MIGDNWIACPYYTFRPGDWMNDAGLRSCSLAARGLWIDMNCIMHQGDPYGHLALAVPSRNTSRKILPATLARIVGSSEKEVVALLAELEDAGVFSRTAFGHIYSRQMVSQVNWKKDSRYNAWFNIGPKSGENPNARAFSESQSRLQATSPSTSVGGPSESSMKACSKGSKPSRKKVK